LTRATVGNKNKNLSMATFTVNSEKRMMRAVQQTQVFDKAFFFSISLIFVVGAFWATERVLLHLIEKEISGYKEITAQGLAGADSQAINEVEDFAARSALVQEYQDQPSALETLQTLERSTIPQVRLTEYSYNDDGKASLSGVTTDYRYVAEQLLRYRQEQFFQNMQVTATDRSEEGQLTFSFAAESAKETNQQSIEPPAAPPTPLP
jgi:hypothetical protein